MESLPWPEPRARLPLFPQPSPGSSPHLDSILGMFCSFEKFFLPPTRATNVLCPIIIKKKSLKDSNGLTIKV